VENGHVRIHDPDLDPDRFEGPAAGRDLILPEKTFVKMARYGKGKGKLAVVVRKTIWNGGKSAK
jgi:hypothetical protein